MWSKINDDYSISEEGNVRNDKRNTLLKGFTNSKGYLRVSIHGKYQFIHRLVANAFIPNPDNKPQVNHKDTDKLNNNKSNLEWMTNIENTIHAYTINNRAKFSYEDIQDILSSSLTRLQLANKYNVPKITIHSIKQGKNMKRFKL